MDEEVVTLRQEITFRLTSGLSMNTTVPIDEVMGILEVHRDRSAHIISVLFKDGTRWSISVDSIEAIITRDHEEVTLEYTGSAGTPAKSRWRPKQR